MIEIVSEKVAKRQKALMDLLRNQGNYFHNIGVLKGGNGYLVVNYRPKSNKSSGDYRVCEFCLGYYGRRNLFRIAARQRRLEEEGA